MCWKITEPSIIGKVLDGNLLGLEFNETVILNEDWTEEHWVMNVSGPMEPYHIEWDFLSETILKVPYENISIWFQFEMINDVLNYCFG